MQKWIVPANRKKYNHHAAFAKFGYIDWSSKENFSEGDEVYIYCAKPYQKIMYKTQVVRVSIPIEEITNDKEFWTDEKEYEKDRSKKHVRLKLLEQADNENLILKN